MDESSKKYEQSHIQKLQEERERIQEKTFTKWINSHLGKVNLKIDDMFKDLRDGKLLMSLLEVISNVNLGKRNRGTLRVQMIENVNKALKYIQSKVILENIGAEDIVDGNRRLILGLIWTIILRFQIQEMLIETESGESKSVKEALLLWCQRKTKDYKNVDIKDFHKSWRDGLAFNALIHTHCPDLIDYEKLVPENHQKNLAQAFTVAEKELSIPNLLDPEDIDVERPDDKSIMTYVSSLYLTFAKMKTENTGAKRVGKIVSNALEITNMIEDYERLVRSILQWIQKKIIKLNDRDLPNSLLNMQKQMHEFKEYRTVEKPPKFAERSKIDEKLFQIIIKQKENNMKCYIPSEGLLIKEVEVAWENLEKAEHAREMVLREELLRQERLEQAAEKFHKKAGLRESWLNEIVAVLNNINVGYSIQSIEAQINKEELVANEINTAKERFQKLRELANNLEDNKYHDKDTISQRNSDIQNRWKKLQDLIASKLADSGKLAFVISTLRTIHTINLEFDILKPQISSTDFGKHFMAAEDILEKHNLVDCQLKALADRFNQLKYKTRAFLDSTKSQSMTNEQRQTLESQLKALHENINDLINVSQKRREQLIQNCKFHKLASDLEEEESWVSNQINAMNNKDAGHDLSSVLRLIRRHQVYESEINAHVPIFDKLKILALELCKDQYARKNEIEHRIESLSNGWKNLNKGKNERRNLLKDAHECQKYYADADDAQQWIAEHFPLVLNRENGDDEGASQALIKRHNALLEEVTIFGEHDMKRLQELVILMTKPADKHDIRPENVGKLRKMESMEITDKIENNMIQIPVEDIEDLEEGVELEEEEETPENLWYVAISSYDARDANGRDMSLTKDEIYKIIKKADNVWWLVETKDKKKGYVPASHLQQYEDLPKMRKPRQLKKSKTLVKKWFPMDSEIAKNYLARQSRVSMHAEIFKGPTVRKQDELHYDKVNIEKRQNELNGQYNELVGLAKARFFNLQGSTLCHQFFKECDSFMHWMKDKEDEFSQRSSMALDVEGTKKKYEALIDDLAANSGRVNDINDLAVKIQNIKPQSEPEISKLNAQVLSKIPFPVEKAKVDNRHKEINNQWEKLNKLKCDKEKSLAGASSIDLFNKTGEELKESLNQKLGLLSDDNVGYDKDSNEALERKFQNLLRDVDAIKNRMERFKYLGDGVRKTYPSEIKYVDKKIKEIDDLYDTLQKALQGRSNDLKNAGNVHKFLNDSKDNEQRLNELNAIIENQIIPKDVSSVESCIQQHEPLKYEINVAETNLDKLKLLANQVMKERPNDAMMGTTLGKLNDKMKTLKEMEAKRAKDLEDALQAQKFYKECDQLESIISQQACKLDSINPELSVDDVERALKNHANLEAFIERIGQRVNNLSKRKDLLKHNPDKEKIVCRSDKVLEKVQKLNEKCENKKNELDNDLEFAKFNENANELNEWIDDKLIIIQDDNYKELFNLPEKMQKHKALEAEIKANTPSLEKMNNWGNDLLKNQHPKKDLIEGILRNTNKKWNKLNLGTEDKEKKLRQAHDQSELNEDIDSILRKFDSISGAMKSPQMGEDLPSAKSLIGKHNILELELQNQLEKLAKLKQKAAEMAGDDHFDKGNILDDIKKLELKCEELMPIVNKRKKDLNNNLKWHQFAFDVDQELQWIEENRSLAALNDSGRSLADAFKLANKHKKLMTELASHKPVINKLLDFGNDLKIEVAPLYQKDIATRSKELKDDWDKLEKQSEDRKYKLDLSAQGHQLLDDFNDIDLWINEKSYYVNPTEKDLDTDQIENRVNKLKSINVDMATYENLLKNISQHANVFKEMCKKNNVLPELVDAICRKCNDIVENFEDFKTSLNEKQNMLENSQEFQDFQNEISDIEVWIDEKLKIADSNDFGEDLPQMENLKDRWESQLKAIELGEDRILSCNQKANHLLKSLNSRSDEIASLQEDMMKEWKRLQEFSAKKNAKFDAAEEIHKFNKLCKDFTDLINVDNISLPSKCKDRNAINSAQIRFETFAKEMEQMNNQLKDISDTAVKLQQKYPNNADAIDDEVDHLKMLWQQLVEFNNHKNDELQYCIDYLNLYDKLKETMEFLNDINIKMKTDRNINTVLAADEQLTEANECMVKLNKHNPIFIKLVAFSEDIISDDACENVNEIQNHIDEMLNKKNAIFEALEQWIDKSEKILVQQKFYRDIHQINFSTAFQEVKVKVNNFDLDLEETEKLLIKHRNFAHNISVTDDRVKTLSNFVSNMKETNHFDIRNITASLNDCNQRRQKLHDNYRDIEIKLNDQLSWLVFLRDTDDKNFWIDEKLQQIKTLDKSANNLEEKMHLLQKYKAFEAEISANTPEFEKLVLITSDLIKNKHPKSQELKEICGNLKTKWDQLLSESKYRSKVLQEAKDLLTFFDEIDAIEAWHREKEFLVSANELGADLDHCMSLQAKLTEPVGGKQVDGARIYEITRTADELLKRKTVPTLEAENIKSRSQSIKPRWEALKTALDTYKDRLEEAYKMHNYYSELGLLSDQVKDRIKLMKVKDLGADIASVEKLRRKQNAIERDIIVLNEKFQKLRNLDAFGENLDADHSIRISMKQKEIKDDLDELSVLASQKTDLLNLSYRFFKVEKDANILIDISTKQANTINSSGWPTDSKTTKAAFKVHDNIRTEINTRKIKENRIADLCRKLKEDRDTVSVKDEKITVIPTNEQLKYLQDNLLSCVKETQNAWTKRQQKLSECLQIHTFLEACEVEEQWLLTQDKKCDIILNSVGSLSSVEDVAENMESKRAISSIISVRETKTLKGSLSESLEQLRKSNIQDLNLAVTKHKLLSDHFAKLNEKLLKMHQTLSSEKELQELRQRVLDHTNWIRNKLLIASDANYEDKVNLSNKIKKHKEFLSEVKANEPDIKAVNDLGRRLISENHNSSVEIEQEITDLDTQWNNLLSMSDFKMRRLLDTNDELLWSRRVEGFISWLNETEKILESHDYGSDLISVERLRRKQTDIEVDSNSHNELLQTLSDEAKRMISKDNYLISDIKTNLEIITSRFTQLGEFLKNYSDNLADTEILYQLNCDIYYELDWIQDKMQLANKTELGSSLAETDRFIKQHAALMSEISARSKTIESITNKAQDLEKRNHFAKETVKSQRLNLQKAYERLCNAQEDRVAKLSANKAYQQFAGDVIEVDMRLKDKILLLRNFENGSDEQSCQNLMKKLDGLNLEIDTESVNITKLSELTSDISPEYQNKTKDLVKTLQNKLTEIREIIMTKRNAIVHNLKFYQFVRETEDILTWIKNQNSLVIIDEYGKDYDDCISLMEKFDEYNQTLNANKNKLSAVKNGGKQLIAEKNPFSSQIENMNLVITENMNELKENFKIRKDALQGALEVHTFVRESNDLIDWIKNKNIEISSLKHNASERFEDPDGLDMQSDKTDAILNREFNQPLSVVQKMENNFAKFERDLEAVKNQIERLKTESNRLQTVYPDAKDHIREKDIESERTWNALNMAVLQKRNKLKETKQLQLWLLQYKDLLNWAKAQNVRIISVNILPTDVPGAELLIVINDEEGLEIDSKAVELAKLMKSGDEIKANARFIYQIMDEKQTHLQKIWDNMCHNLSTRRDLYEQNLDLRKFLMEITDLEKWLATNENQLKSVDEKSFKNVPDIEEATKNHEDYMKFVDGEKSKFEAIKRSTKLEMVFKKILEEEQNSTDNLFSSDINVNIKRRETQRILQEKRKENDSVQRTGSGGYSDSSKPSVIDGRSKKPLKKQLSAGHLDIKPTIIKPVKFGMHISDIDEESFQTTNSEVFAEAPVVKKVTSFSTKKRDQLKAPLTRSNSTESGTSVLRKTTIASSVVRKQIKTSKGLKAAVRSWKDCYAVLEGHQLSFYKDKIAYLAQPENHIFSDNLQNCVMDVVKNYTKRNYVIQFKLDDLSEFYVQFKSPEEQLQWVPKLVDAQKMQIIQKPASAQMSVTTKNVMDIQPQAIDVSSVIDNDFSDIIYKRPGSSSADDRSKGHVEPSTPPFESRKSKPIIKLKVSTRHSGDRPVTEYHDKEKFAGRQYSCEYLSLASNRNQPSQPATINRMPPVSLSLIKHRQLSLEAKSKTLSSHADGGDQAHKNKSKGLIKKIFPRSSKKKDSEKSDEV